MKLSCVFHNVFVTIKPSHWYNTLLHILPKAQKEIRWPQIKISSNKNSNSKCKYTISYIFWLSISPPFKWLDLFCMEMKPQKSLGSCKQVLSWQMNGLFVSILNSSFFFDWLPFISILLSSYQSCLIHIHAQAQATHARSFDNTCRSLIRDHRRVSQRLDLLRQMLLAKAAPQ